MSNFSTPLSTPQEFRAPRLTKGDVATIGFLHWFAYLMGILCVLALGVLGWKLFLIYNSPEWNFDPAKLSQVQTELIGLQTNDSRYHSNITIVNSRLSASLPYHVAASSLPAGIQLKSLDYTVDSQSDGGTGKVFLAKVTIQGTGPESSGSLPEEYVTKMNNMDPSQIGGFTPKATLTSSSVVKAADPNGPNTLMFSISLNLSTPLP
jgi:hypothetical protein